MKLPKGPWGKVGIDIKGPLGDIKSRFLITTVDYYSKWPEVYATNRISSSEIVNALRETLFKFALHKIIVSYNGDQLISKEVEPFLAGLVISHYKVALYSPKQNGLVEHFNRVLSEKIKEATKFDWDVMQTIEHTLFNYRSTPHNTTRVTPFGALFGRKMRDKLTSLAPEGVLQGK